MEDDVNSAPHFHVGVIVADLDEAIITSPERLGLSFTDPVVSQLEHFVVNGSEAPGHVQFAYSMIDSLKQIDEKE